jgi:CRISPR-associated protein Cas2
MLIVSYDIASTKLRTKFSKMLQKKGGIRLQFSVYEFNNVDRLLDNLKVIIETEFAKQFGGGDSVLIFDANGAKTIKYGNAIHRDQDMVFFG